MRLLLLLVIPLLFTACDTSTAPQDVTNSYRYSPDCLAYASHMRWVNSGAYYSMLEGCKTREMLDNFAN